MAAEIRLINVLGRQASDTGVTLGVLVGKQETFRTYNMSETEALAMAESIIRAVRFRQENKR